MSLIAKPRRTVKKEMHTGGKFLVHTYEETCLRIQITFPESLSYFRKQGFHFSLLEGSKGSAMIHLRSKSFPKYDSEQHDPFKMLDKLVYVQTKDTRIELFLKPDHPLLPAIQNILKSKTCGATDVIFAVYPDQLSLKIMTPDTFEKYNPREKVQFILEKEPGVLFTSNTTAELTIVKLIHQVIDEGSIRKNIDGKTMQAIFAKVLASRGLLS